MRREMWQGGDHAFGVEHKIRKGRLPEGHELRTKYENLLYACNRCNAFREAALQHRRNACTDGPNKPPIDPDQDGVGNHLSVDRDGTVEFDTPLGEKFIETFRLNLPELVSERKRWIELARQLDNPDLDEDARSALQEFFGYPEQLPDLSKKRPPENDAPESSDRSHLQKRRDDDLSETY